MSPQDPRALVPFSGRCVPELTMGLHQVVHINCVNYVFCTIILTKRIGGHWVWLFVIFLVLCPVLLVGQPHGGLQGATLGIGGAISLAYQGGASVWGSICEQSTHVSCMRSCMRWPTTWNDR